MIKCCVWMEQYKYNLQPHTRRECSETKQCEVPRTNPILYNLTHSSKVAQDKRKTSRRNGGGEGQQESNLQLRVQRHQTPRQVEQPNYLLVYICTSIEMSKEICFFVIVATLSGVRRGGFVGLLERERVVGGLLLMLLLLLLLV